MSSEYVDCAEHGKQSVDDWGECEQCSAELEAFEAAVASDMADAQDEANQALCDHWT